jgi:hypothetical protein
MANKFEAASAPTVEPDTITQGSLAQWVRKDLPEYPASAYRLHFNAIDSTRQNTITAQSANDGNGNHLFSLSSTTTAAYAAGSYYWQVEIEQLSDSERVLDRRGTLEVRPDLAQSGVEARSHAEIMLDKIESLLENRADKDVSNYSISGRSISKMTIAELLEWRGYYRSEVRQQRDKEARAQGKSSSSRIKVRFT